MKPLLTLLLIGYSALNAQWSTADSLQSNGGRDAEYQQWLQQTRQQYQNYLDENDKAFSQFLKQRWQAVEVQAERQRDREPKPDSLPVVPPTVALPAAPPVSATPPTEKPDPVSPAEALPKPLPKPVTLARPTETPSTKQPMATRPALEPSRAQAPTQIPTAKNRTTPSIQFYYFGHQLTVEYPQGFKSRFIGRPSGDKIAEYWKTLARTPHAAMVEELNRLSQSLALNEWGTALLVQHFTSALYRGEANPNSQVLTQWFLLVKAGFDARVAYSQGSTNRVYLLLPADQQLYGVTYFMQQGRPYYAVQFDQQPLKNQQLYTYKGQHQLGKKQITFDQPNRFIPQSRSFRRDLSFTYADQTYQVRLHYPERYADYLNQYPQLELSNYFKAGLPSELAEQLLDQLRPVIAEQSHEEAVNRLLRFVQTAFEYKTDNSQFQQENYLYPLETLYYPYSDCEDRAALFAWLTENLLGIDVVILNYPGHVATAVALDTRTGDSWMVNGQKYTVADPTYVNATLGMTMPAYQQETPEVSSY